MWRRAVPDADDWDWDKLHATNITRSGAPPDRYQSVGESELPDLFGTTIALNEPAGYLFVSSPRAVAGPNDPRGSVFVYQISNASAEDPQVFLKCQLNLTNYLPKDSVLRNDSVDTFGFGLASSGRFLAVSAPGLMIAQESAHISATFVWIFARNGSVLAGDCPWQYSQAISNPETHGSWNSEFGFSLSIKDLQDSAVLAVGARFAPVTPANSSHELLPAGAVVIYRWSPENQTFCYNQTLSSPHGQWRNALGSSVDLNDDATMLVAGAVEVGPNVQNPGKGHAFLFSLNGTSTFQRVAEMHDTHGMKEDFFGASVLFEHHAPQGHCRVAVGSLQTWRSEANKGQSNGRGAVFVFTCDTIPADGQLTMLWDVASSASSKNNGEFGTSIAYDPTSLIVGAPSAPMFVRVNLRNSTEIPDCGQMWVFDVKRQASLPIWTIVLIAVTSVLIAGFLVISVVCLIRRRRRRPQYSTLN